MKTKIHFIVNPISGKGKNELCPTLLATYFPEADYDLVIKKTEFANHATQLTNSSMEEEAEIIVACGGDGTINEVASCVVNTSIVLGILPMGSGNGLASNLKIPKNRGKGLSIIRNRNITSIDTATINGSPFFSNTGVGFDAHVISDYEEKARRRLFSYVQSTFRTLKKFNTGPVEVSCDGFRETFSPFLLFVSNSNEMGYKMSLTPKASLQDGLLDLIIVPKLSRLKLIYFTILFLFKKHHWMKEVKFKQVNKLKIKSLDDTVLKIQKDGGLFVPDSPDIEIVLYPENLKVCVP
ncbi:diacylglycerol kinase family lipid kinase [Aequorivita sp. H23M31]|uniref:Diacylglycerol kinase family lipid kinase n=1 Tax=Aequorivita ciconiae TaxID=2494375 RepID=A0A410G6Y6_9FLAO|nr:diacylglycerol kinase family protein [Aequorivita sp. H23M31]QAA83026.1 diacylglycerol kinase family lipid kinase [Aequorivita sp. H23M31]